jgi:hypothetical protein
MAKFHPSPKNKREKELLWQRENLLLYLEFCALIGEVPRAEYFLSYADLKDISTQTKINRLIQEKIDDFKAKTGDN